MFVSEGYKVTCEDAEAGISPFFLYKNLSLPLFLPITSKGIDTPGRFSSN